ncbi:MAG TPA: vWA domain-containing protein [Nitrososphaeraceae archaeon]
MSSHFERNLTFLKMRNDVLIDIATFLARRWSGRGKVIITLSQDKIPLAKPEKNQISLPFLEHFPGTDFQKYRQWRVALWYESMRMAYSSKVLSYEHAYGFILNTLETKRIEILGLRYWYGMLNELIYNEAMSWLGRPVLNTMYGHQKTIEAFSQYFSTGYIKGELFGREFEKVRDATGYANSIVQEAIEFSYSTDWLEKHIPKLIKMLELNPLLTIPISVPRTKFGVSMNQSDIIKQVERIVKRRTKQKDVEKASKQIIEGNEVLGEFDTLVKESKRTEVKGFESLENFGLSIPEKMDIDESFLYDPVLIQKIKSKFRDWKTGWLERHDYTGEEFDPEVYVERLPKPFLADFKMSIKTRIAILLDHSSSIQDVELKYKQATVALCEALSYLNIKFSVYAFSTEARQVKCWIIKPVALRWSSICARRLAQIKASGGTPLAEIYALLQPTINLFKPDILVTLTDGEPSDYDAVRAMVLSYKESGIHMVALGLGRNLQDSINVGQNLRYLNYEKSLAASRLEDIPQKVINLLRH